MKHINGSSLQPSIESFQYHISLTSTPKRFNKSNYSQPLSSTVSTSNNSLKKLDLSISAITLINKPTLNCKKPRQLHHRRKRRGPIHSSTVIKRIDLNDLLYSTRAVLSDYLILNSSYVYELMETEELGRRSFGGTGHRNPDKIWNNTLRPGIQSILANSPCFSECDSACRALMRERCGKKLYANTRALITEHLVGKVRETILQASVTEFLGILKSEWNVYDAAIIILSNILRHMDHFYARVNGLNPTRLMCVILFRENIVNYPTIQEHLKSSLLNTFDQCQHDGVVDETMMKDICHMLIAMDSDNLSLYTEYFETPFLQHSANAYQRESEKLLAENNASQYIREISARISQESMRFINCYPKSTVDRIVRTAEEEFIEKHAKRIIEMESSGVVHMIESKNYDDLSLMYQLFKRIPNGHWIVVNCVNAYFQKRREALKIGDEKNGHHVQFLDDLLELIDTFENIRRIVFENDISLQQKFKFDSENLNNINQRHTAYLSSLVKDKFENGVTHFDKEQLVALFKAIVLLNYLNEKDLFVQYYENFTQILKKIMDNKDENNTIHIHIQNLLNLKDIFDIFLKRPFNGDETYKKQIDFDLECFINSKQHISEYISLFINNQLLSDCNNDDGNMILDKITALIEYLRDKYDFQQYYLKHFAQRLLSKRSISDNMENKMISRLRIIFGPQFEHHLKSMNNDILISKTNMNKFQAFLVQESLDLHGIDLSMLVLTRDFWPLRYTNNQCNLPRTIQQVYQCFHNFYTKTEKNRRLILEPSCGAADLTLAFYDRLKNEQSTIKKLNEQKYLLHVSTYQMIVLMLFNEKESWSFEEIHEKTNINEHHLQCALLSLVRSKTKTKVLVKQPKRSDIQPNDRFYVNDSFKSKHYFVKVKQMRRKSESNQERQEAQLKVEIIRHHEIDAAIVRIMKMHKTMQHIALIMKVVHSLKERFQLTCKVVETRIEALIEREYLSCTTHDSRKQYNYLA
ncbi:unnamed protein product [Rotaria magnacalcarata]|uniref:Cullin family profile domain-containing protein n=1 Tax=Rotaria magnacalcarata TaxID=392030 RepID=A0A816S4Z0_9BILA|nr:unnamed protein product [Rotaria magnacalcarata]